jgi:pyruvate dehydrogenase E2 component (dihydrolipoamide acetyltransferase)
MTDPAAERSGFGSDRRLPLSKMQAAVGRQMAESKRTIPHFYLSTDIQMDGLLSGLRRVADQSEGAPRISVTACLVHLLARTLAEHETFTAAWTPEGFVLTEGIHVGVAIALDAGLLAPALRNCENLDLVGTAVALEDLVSRAKVGRLRAQELGSATFTLSNLGMFDLTSFAAIIPSPQVGILAVGRAQRRPWVHGTDIVIRSVMTATLSADHRAVDGAQAARFLCSFKARVESFGAGTGQGTAI